MMKMDIAIRNKRTRAIAELMVKCDKGKVTGEEFSAEYERLMKDMPPSAHLRYMSLYRQVTGDTGQSMMMGRGTGGNVYMAEEPLQWDAPEIPAYRMKPPTDDGTGGSSAP